MELLWSQSREETLGGMLAGYRMQSPISDHHEAFEQTADVVISLLRNSLRAAADFLPYPSW